MSSDSASVSEKVIDDMWDRVERTAGLILGHALTDIPTQTRAGMDGGDPKDVVKKIVQSTVGIATLLITEIEEHREAGHQMMEKERESAKEAARKTE